MMEFLPKWMEIAAMEIAGNRGETKSTFDPDKKIDKKEISSSPESQREKVFDPDKKIDKTENSFSPESQQKESLAPNVDEEKPQNELPCRNKDLEGKKHPETGVPFVRKTVIDGDGREVSVVVPEFDSDFDAQLPEELEKSSDKEQFAECNKQLKEAIKNDPELKKKFTDEQLEQIENGDTPDGYTWHHDAEKGKLQLVDSEVHAKTGHTGGRTIWGGGQENR